MSKISEGELAFELDGKPRTLRCTLKAVKAINRTFGNFTTAFQRVVENDFDAIVAVLAAGLDEKPAAVEDEIYQAGFVQVRPDAAAFLDLLSRGGKPIPSAEEAAEGNEPAAA
jgi:hypothetical protein